MLDLSKQIQKGKPLQYSGRRDRTGLRLKGSGRPRLGNWISGQKYNAINRERVLCRSKD